MLRRLVMIPLLASALIGAVHAGEPTWKKDISPIFKAKCTKCHGLLVKQKGLSLRKLKSALAGGESGAAIVPGKPNASLLFKQLSLPAKDPKRMPPIAEKAQLSAKEKKLIETWIESGAK